MGRQDFNRKQCIRALLKLGFVKDNKRRGSHDKFKAPEHVLQLEILKELWAFGGDAFVEEFLGHIK